ncbi:MAG TPA: 5-(carboxyamino)imidazole ribonucleotide mutase, partial [Alicycliphilus sp.]|nr:5-(carboxyamino)imidazole ribonucleotide mutase [Alicycliphilus sp.]
ALFAVALLANHDPALRQKLEAFRAEQTAAARAMTLPPVAA